MRDKAKVATASLAGCFGCHMSFLDIDERLFELVKRIDFDRCPFTDVKHMSMCDVGLIEGGVANSENVEVLLEFRKHCDIVVAVGACAITGGIPSMRNRFELHECLNESYVDGLGIVGPEVPVDPEIPLLLDKVRPIQEVVEVDHFLPGCPPSADAIWEFLTRLLARQSIKLSYAQLRYD